MKNHKNLGYWEVAYYFILSCTFSVTHCLTGFIAT